MLRNELYRPWFVGSEDWGFEIISGDFTNTVVQIKKLDLPSEDSEMVIDYHVINKPTSISDEEITGENFKLLFETIVNDILTEAFDTLEDEQNRTNNTAQSST